jgi:hypothetical protein
VGVTLPRVPYFCLSGLLIGDTRSWTYEIRIMTYIFLFILRLLWEGLNIAMYIWQVLLMNDAAYVCRVEDKPLFFILKLNGYESRKE